MAISRIDPKKIVKLVSTQDGAIDLEKSPKMERSLKIDGLSDEQLKYEETLNLKDLVFKEGEEPTYFLVRNLLSSEQAELYQEHMVFDAESRKNTMKDMPKLLIKLFERCCKEVEENGQKSKTLTDEWPYAVVQEIGSFILRRMQVSDQEKKV